MGFWRDISSKTGIFGSPNIEKLKEKKDVPGLINAMKRAKTPEDRNAATEALIQLGQIAVDPIIQQLLVAEEEPFLTSLSDSLLGIGASAVGRLIGLMDNEAGLKLAVPILAKIGEPAVMQLLEVLNSQSNETKKLGVIQALGTIGADSSNEPLRRIISNNLAGAAVYFDFNNRPPLWPGASISTAFNLEWPCFEALIKIGDLSTLRAMAMLSFHRTFHSRAGIVFQQIAMKAGRNAILPILEILTENPVTEFGHDRLLEFSDNVVIIDILEKLTLSEDDQQMRNHVIEVLISIFRISKLDPTFQKRIIVCLQNLTGKEIATTEEWQEWWRSSSPSN